MCFKLFESSPYYKIERIHDRIYPIEYKITDETNKNRLLFINFKSFEILNKDHREKFFEIITKTSPDYICLTEALVPTCFISQLITNFDLNKYLDQDIVEHPLKMSNTIFEQTKREGYKKEVNERIFTQ